MTTRRIPANGWLWATILLVAATPIFACAIPVFRYALERWPGDPYEAIVYHRGPLSDAHRDLVNRLTATATDEAVTANLRVTLVDVAAPKPDAAAPAAASGFSPDDVTVHQPILTMHMPRTPRGGDRDVWTGPLTADALTNLVDSPARAEVAKRILDGDSAVWVLLESGDKAADDAAAALLAATLEEKQKTLALPAIEDIKKDEKFKTDTTVDLRLAFSVVRIAANDPAERWTVAMLMASEPDLRSLTGEPMAFPVFGRGRALYALIGAGINRDTIDEACRYLVGACSCEVKAENPGVDLLMGVAWDKLIKGQLVVDKPLPDLTSLAALAPDEAAPVEPAAATVQVAGYAVSWPLWVPIVAVLALGGLAVVVGTLFMKSRESR